MMGCGCPLFLTPGKMVTLSVMDRTESTSPVTTSYESRLPQCARYGGESVLIGRVGEDICDPFPLMPRLTKWLGLSSPAPK